MPHTDAQILCRKIGLGPLGSAKINELSMPSHNQAGDLTEATCVTNAHVKAGAFASHLAPIAAVSFPPPPAAMGAPLFVPCHAGTATKGKP